MINSNTPKRYSVTGHRGNSNKFIYMTFRLNVKEKKSHSGISQTQEQISKRLGGISILWASQNPPARGRCPARWTTCPSKTFSDQSSLTKWSPEVPFNIKNVMTLISSTESQYVQWEVIFNPKNQFALKKNYHFLVSVSFLHLFEISASSDWSPLVLIQISLGYPYLSPSKAKVCKGLHKYL